MPPSSKLVRWIDLVTALLRHRFPISFSELARDVPDYAHEGAPSDTLKRMFERDKDELRDAGIAIETVSDGDGEPSLYRLRAEAFYLPFLVLSGAAPPAGAPQPGYRALRTLALLPEEAAMLRRAAERIASLGAPPLTQDALRALRKLRYDLPAELAAPSETRPVTAGSGFRTLVEAIERGKTVTFTYHSMGRGEREARHVEPYGLVFVTGHWYLVARDPAAEALRQFRTSRMTAVKANTRAASTRDFTVPADFDLKAHARSRPAWALGSGDVERIDVAFRGEGGDVRAARQLGTPVESADGASATWQFAVRRRDTFLRWVLAFAGDAVPVGPEAVVREWRALVARTHAAHVAARTSSDATSPRVHGASA